MTLRNELIKQGYSNYIWYISKEQFDEFIKTKKITQGLKGKILKYLYVKINQNTREIMSYLHFNTSHVFSHKCIYYIKGIEKNFNINIEMYMDNMDIDNSGNMYCAYNGFAVIKGNKKKFKSKIELFYDIDRSGLSLNLIDKGILLNYMNFKIVKDQLWYKRRKPS